MGAVSRTKREAPIGIAIGAVAIVGGLLLRSPGRKTE
jgi:hypothetical protein